MDWTLDAVRAVLARVPSNGSDTSLVRFQAAVGGRGPDLRLAAHATAARVWLNAWGCRLAYPRPGADDVLAAGLAEWWPSWSGALPPARQTLASLRDDEIRDVASSFGALQDAPASARRRLGSTAAAKLLYALRPAAVTPWDLAISRRPGVDGDFGLHLTEARSIARAWDEEAVGRGIEDVPSYLGRPSATVARILDEALYLRVTRGW